MTSRGALIGEPHPKFLKGSDMTLEITETSEIASRINEEHSRAFSKAQDALSHARNAGELLIEAKSLLKHGEWGKWLAENVSFTDRTAQSYMRLARNWESLAKNEMISDLGLVKTLSLLSGAPKIGDYVEAWVPPLFPDRDYLTCPFGDSRCLTISPSLTHEGYYELTFSDPMKSSALDFATLTPEGIEMYVSWFLEAVKKKGVMPRWMVCIGGTFSSKETDVLTRPDFEESMCNLKEFRTP